MAADSISPPRYVQRTADVQTAALLVSYANLSKTSKSPSASRGKLQVRGWFLSGDSRTYTRKLNHAHSHSTARC